MSTVAGTCGADVTQISVTLQRDAPAARDAARGQLGQFRVSVCACPGWRCARWDSQVLEHQVKSVASVALDQYLADMSLEFSH
jgi:hypothetical protein